MAQQLLNSRLLSFKAGADLSASMYKLVKLDSNGDIVLSANNDLVVGVLQSQPKSGEVGAVAIGETSKVKLGGTVAIGNKVISDANGNAILRPTPAVGQTVHYNVVGIALEAGVSGDIIEVLIKQYNETVTG